MDKDEDLWILAYTPGLGVYWMSGSQNLLFNPQRDYLEAGEITEILSILPYEGIYNFTVRSDMRWVWEKHLQMLEQQEPNHG